MSPTSYMIVSGGEDVPNHAQDSAEYSDDRVKKYPQVHINTFADIAQMSSPQHNGVYRARGDGKH